MTFSELQAGDVFMAHGAMFQKLPWIMAAELPDANAINIVTRRPAFFGATVAVEFMKHDDPVIHGGTLQPAVACDALAAEGNPL
jgi:hypothetical protein